MLFKQFIGKQEFKKAVKGMEKHQSLESANGLREIIKVESDVGKYYCSTFSKLFKQELGFRARNDHRTFRPRDASDAINGLSTMALGYFMPKL